MTFGFWWVFGVDLCGRVGFLKESGDRVPLLSYTTDAKPVVLVVVVRGVDI